MNSRLVNSMRDQRNPGIGGEPSLGPAPNHTAHGKTDPRALTIPCGLGADEPTGRKRGRQPLQRASMMIAPNRKNCRVQARPWQSWPEILQELNDSSIRNYTIFLCAPENAMLADRKYPGTDFARHI
jgi:hypothetical protein